MASLSELAKLYAAVLGVRADNIDIVRKTASFNKIWEALFKEKPFNEINIEAAKESIILEFKKQNSAVLKKHLLEALAKLYEEGILDAYKLEEYEKTFVISEIIDTPQAEKIEYGFTDKTFSEKLDILYELLSKLYELTQSPLQRIRFDKVKETLDERSFSIGVTGVMNAGKSTLLNAILRADILGTAVVPETANLTVLKYASTAKAVVNFWNKQEWQSMEKSGGFLPKTAKFIDGAKSKFGASLDDFIINAGRSDEIDIQDISLYTSAHKSDMKCALVKSVELYADNAFLKDGVTIVDTPGLDDPVVKREEITREYLSSCDLMIHLMNAAQSATAKDIDFIIDALTYHGISKILIVITRVDMINEEELNEVIEYAKTSIKMQLERQNRGGLFKSVIEKIEFIPVAAKFALLHRTGRAKDAEDAGYSEEKSGIFAVENYLNQTLFGGEKANLLIASNAKILYLAASESLSAYEKESRNLNKSSDQLRADLKRLQSQNDIQEAKIESLLSAIKSILTELEEFAKTLLLEMDTRANGLHNKLFSRVFDDVKYELEKNKKMPSFERVIYIVQSGLKDGILDLTRDYRFSFSKQSVLAQEKLLLRFADLKLDLNIGSFDAKAFFASNAFSVGQNFEELSARILSALKKCSKSTLNRFGENLNAILKDEFIILKQRLSNALANLNDMLLGEFQMKNEEPLKFLQSFMREEVADLNKQINLLELHANEAKKRDVIIQKRCAELREIIKQSAELHGSI
ncbi:MAG: dynamin family protein [Campylobacteraceae bacterium]|jgi:predicted GTPase/chaperonin cofactor prefoldin|nr:dynamin family protein [Campylobacteraceae bacterium]